MRIELNRISPTGLELNGSIALDEQMLIEEQGLFDDGIRYGIRLHRSGEQVNARGNIKTTVSLPCVRCLEPFHMKIDSDFDVILFPAGLIEKTNPALKADDMEYVFFEGDQIDISRVIMEQVNLFMPLRPLCNEACKGLCSKCGKNLNYENCQCENSFTEANFLFDKLK